MFLIQRYKLAQRYKDKYKVAQRVLSFKKKTKLTVLNIHSKLLNNLEIVS